MSLLALSQILGLFVNTFTDKVLSLYYGEFTATNSNANLQKQKCFSKRLAQFLKLISNF